MDKMWWNYITKAHKFLEDVVNIVVEGNSLILCLPENVPWYYTLVDLISEKLQMENPKNSVEQIQCPLEEEVGLFLLNKYCRKEKRAMYRYGMTYASFLGKSEDIVLNDRYVWVTDIPKHKYDEWLQFIVEYNKNVTTKTPAIFILETKDESFAHKAKKGIKKILYHQNISAYDKFAFCTLTTAERNCKEYMRPYLAELVATICSEDIELCAECVGEGAKFLENPMGVIQTIVQTKYRSNGEAYSFVKDKAQVEKLIWEVQLKYAFPRVEEYRNYFTTRYANAIQTALPIRNSYGEDVNNPQDVEIGMLFYMAKNKDITVDLKEYTKLFMYKEARNKLAHLNILELSVMEEILMA